MSFGFNVRCCMVVESYIFYVFCTNIELFRDGHYLCRRRGCYRTVQQTNQIQSCSLNQPITYKVVV